MARRVDTIRTPSYLLVSVGNSGLVGNGPPLGRSEAISRLKEVRLTMREGYRTARRPLFFFFSEYDFVVNELHEYKSMSILSCALRISV